MDDITIGVTEFVNNILVSAQPNDQTIDITVTETVETVLLDVSTTVQEVTVTATQNVIVENITVDYVNNENNIDINVTDGTQDVTLNVTPTLVEINILRSGGEVNILQFNTLADFPATGSSDYFYLAKDTNKLYRWTGSAYAEISATANAVWGQIIGTLSEQTDLQNALNLKAPINSPTFTGTVSGITKAMVGLAQVDNTSDLDKPISTATQTALNNKQPLDGDLTSIAALSGTFGLLKKTANNSYTIDTNTYLTGITSGDVTTALGFTPENVANKGIANGYASLNGDGKVPSSQLPSYVDDVIEVSSYGTLPTTGETGKIYITLDTNKIYRWSGSVYVEVSSSAAVWGGITGTLSAQTDLQNALNAKENTITAGTTAQYYRGDKTFQTLDTSVVPEGSNLYFTDARVNANGNVTANTAARHNAVTLGTANGLSLSTQVLSLGLSSGSTTGALSSTDWTTFNDKYPASNPNGYTSNVGTVTSVAMTVPSAFSVSGSPITSSGTLAVTATGNTTQYIAGDGSLVTFPTMSTAGTLIREVRNTTGATLTKGTVVYISGATGNKPTVSKAIATGDSTSAQTFGLVQADIANNANGNVVCAGDITGIDTSALTEGAQLYLSSTTAGTYTTTKQLAPNHLVYIGIVTRSHNNLGQIEVNIQNGYELYELHDVSITSEVNNQGLFYEASTDLWKNKSIATVLGYTPANGADYMALTGSQSIAGTKTFTGFGLFDNTIFIKQDSSVSFLAGYNSIDSDATGIIFSLPAGNMAKFILTSLTASRDYTLPNASGTIALTSDIPSLAGYVATTGNQSIAGDKTFTGGVINDGDLYIKQDASYAPKTGYVNLFAGAGNILTYNFGNSNINQSLSFPSTGRVYSFPDAAGTLALTSDLHNAVTIGTANGLSLSTQVLSLGLASTSATGALSSTDWNTFNGKQNALTNPVTGTGTTSYIPKFTGTTTLGNSILYDTGSVLLVGATSASNASSKLELVSSSTVGLKIISSGANGNNTFLSIQANKEWRFLTNRGDLISGNQGDLIIRNDTDNINHIILNQGGGTTFAGNISAGAGTFTATANTYAGGSLILKSSAGTNPIYLTSNSGYFALSNGGGGDHLLITSTGAATFASSVTAANLYIPSSNEIRLYNTNISNWGTIKGSTDSTNGIITLIGGSGNGMTINNAGNVGIGTTSPSVLLHLSGSGNEKLRLETTTSTANYIGFYTGATRTHYFGKGSGGSNDLYCGIDSSANIIFDTNATERMRITSGGQIQSTASGANTVSALFTNGASDGNFKAGFANGSGTAVASEQAKIGMWYGTSGTPIVHFGLLRGNSADSLGITFNVNNSEYMRIDANGRLLVGTTSPISSSGNTSVGATFALTYNWLAVTDSNYIQRSNSTDGDFMVFLRGSTSVGKISCVGTVTSYISLSDYRLKEDLKPLNGLDIVNKINVYDYKLKDSDTRMDGVMAHELQEILPYAVSGIKDGKEMQGVDYSKIVPVMVQAIKDLKSELDTLKNK